jgi:hypothetical protein
MTFLTLLKDKPSNMTTDEWIKILENKPQNMTINEWADYNRNDGVIDTLIADNSQTYSQNEMNDEFNGKQNEDTFL